LVGKVAILIPKIGREGNKRGIWLGYHLYIEIILVVLKTQVAGISIFEDNK
jgi:hypothetical protein